MITDEQLYKFTGIQPQLPVRDVMASMNPSLVLPTDIQQKLDKSVWDSGRIERTKQSMFKSIGVTNDVPPTEVEQKNALNFWWKKEGQFLPRYVLDEIGIKGGETVPTLKESMEMENKHRLTAVKDYLGLEREKGKDPLGDYIVTEGIADPDDVSLNDIKPDLAQVIKAAPVDDLRIVRDTMSGNMLDPDFDEKTFKAINNEIKVKDAMPAVIDAMRKAPLITLLGTDFFNSLTFNLSEYTSRKGKHPIENLLGMPTGSGSAWIQAASRIREQIVAEDPSILTAVGTEVGDMAASLIQFALLPNVSKMNMFSKLSAPIKGAIGIGTKSSLIQALQAPHLGETFTDRLESIGLAGAAGAITGYTFSTIAGKINKLSLKMFKNKHPQFAKYPDETLTEMKSAMKDWGKITSKADHEAWLAKYSTVTEAVANDLKELGETIKPVFKVTPKGFRAGFAEIGESQKAVSKVAKVLAKGKEAAAIKAAQATLSVKTQPSKAVKPVKVLTTAEADSLKKSNLITGEGENIRIVPTAKMRKSIQTKENEIAKLKTRRNELMAQKQFAVAKTKAQEIAKKEIALATLKEKAGIRLEKTTEGFKAKIERIEAAKEFKDDLRNDAVSMVTAIPRELRPGFINRANKVKTLKGLHKLTKEIRQGLEKFERKGAIKTLDKTIGKINNKIDQLPSPQREKLIEIIKGISTKKVSKQPLEGPPRDFKDLDVKARRGRTQLLGDDLESLQRTTQRLASELAGQLESLEPEVDAALRLPNARINNLLLLSNKNAHEISVDDINYINESLQNLFHEAKFKGQLLVRKGERPLSGAKKNAPGEIRESRKAKKFKEKVTAGKTIKPKEGTEKFLDSTKKVAYIDELHLDTLVNAITTANAKHIPVILDTNLHKGMRESAEQLSAWIKVTADEFKKIGFTDLDQIQTKHKVTLAGVKFKVTLSELMSLEMDMRSADNLLQRLNSDGIEVGKRNVPYKKDAHGNDVVDRLAEFKAAVQIVRDNKVAMGLLDFYERMSPAQADFANTKSDLLWGYQIAREENYYPRSRVGDKQISGPKGKISTPPEKIGRYQQRTGGTQPLRLKPWHEVFLSGLESDSALAMAQHLRNARTLINDKDFRVAIKAAGREQELDAIIEILSNAQAMSTSKDVVDVYSQWLLKRRATAVLGFRISTRGTQVMSFYAAQAVTGSQGVVVIKSYSKAEIDKIREISSLMNLRWMSRRVGVEVGTNASDDAFSLLFFGKTKGFTNKGMSGLVKGDQQAIANIYYQLVEPELLTAPRNGKNISPLEWEGENVADLPEFTNATSEEYLYASARRLEYVVRKSQPMFDTLDRSVSMSSTNFWRRSFLMFRTALNAQGSLASDSWIKYDKGLITKEQLATEWGHVAASMAAVAIWKRALKWGLGAGATTILGALGYFQFKEPKDTKETVKDIAKDTAKNISSLNPFTKILATATEIAVDKWIGDDYPWNRDPVENPAMDILNSGFELGEVSGQVLYDTKLWDEFVEENNKADREHNRKIAKKLADDFITALESSYNIGSTLTGLPIQAPAQELLSPFFQKSDITIIREVSFGDVDDPQVFSERVYKLFEDRKEIKKKAKSTRLARTEERKLAILDKFAKTMNKQAAVLREEGDLKRRTKRFKSLERQMLLVEKTLSRIKE